MANIKRQTRSGRKGGWLAAALLLAGIGLAFADGLQTNNFAARAGLEFQRTRTRFQSDTNDIVAAWQFARAAFDFADFATNDTERAAIARQGIAACQALLPRDTNSAPLHYYLAMNDGQFARAVAPSLTAYRLVKVMEREFKTAADLNPSFDYAGPARCLGLLYRDSPGWPFSIGSRRKARDWLEQAAKLAPEYPENLLNLAESYLQWRDWDNAKEQLDALDALWPKAQRNFTGEAWARSWEDWSARRDMARKKLGKISAPAKSPRNGH